MTANSSMKTVSDLIELPHSITCPRSVKMNKGMGGFKTPSPSKPVTDEQFKLQINGESFVAAKKLHNHGLKLGKDGIFRCTLCRQIIELPNNMRQHTEESALHKLKYQAKVDGTMKLHQQSIQIIDKEEKGSEMHDEVKEYCFKAFFVYQ